MPYPMAPMPSFAEFRQKLENEFGCEYKTLPEKLVDDKGQEHDVCYFQRVVGDEKRTCAVPIDDQGEMMTPSMIRNICERLEISLGHWF